MFFNVLSWCWEQGEDPELTKVLILTVLLLVAVITWWRLKSKQEKVLLPPGPWSLPIVGNLFSIDRQLHICFMKLSLKYGPIFKLQLGRKTCVVITSPETAKQVFKDNGVNFADHFVPATAVVYGYDGMDIGFTPYGDHWRMMRKICTSHLLHTGKLEGEALYGLRHMQVKNMVSKIYSNVGSSIDISDHLGNVLFHTMISMLWGNTLDEEERHDASTKVQALMRKAMQLLMDDNISDFFPVLARFDLQGKAREMQGLIKWFDQLFEFVLDKRRKRDSSCKDQTTTDLLQVLLQLVDQADNKTPFTLVNVKAMLMDLVFGPSTMATTVEWALAELLNQPKLMKKAQEELEQVVGLDNIFEEIHLPQLPYLNAIVKETLRLHIPSPFLSPRVARESCVIDGYLIPKDAILFVNAWAIQTDPKHWKDPLLFQPERVLNSSIDWGYKGNDNRYMPFGSGWRNCPGIPLAEKLVPSLLASLLHSFNWELPQGKELDLSADFGFDMKKNVPLVAIPSPRLRDTSLY